ncbi:MAG TPA: S8 family serine peptidase, partial [Bryobacteraceae bacterium]|nr:S8 family serine peptidase [Bryobacteraceae bacterium]
ANIRGLFGDGVRPNPVLTAPVRDVAALGNDGKACVALGNGTLDGAIALVERGDCALELKAIHAQRAGAVGVVIYQPSGIQGVFPIQGLQEAGVPVILIGNNAGVQLKSHLARNRDARATMDPKLTEVSTTEFDTIAAFSSRGPAIFRPSRPTAENGIKPEVAAVGTDLYVATQRYDPNGDMYDPSGYIAVEGTSFAAPVAAGTAAMVKQRYPNMTPAQLKSAVVNTASDEIFDVDNQGRTIRAGVLEAGAGKLNAEAAVRTTVTAEPSTLWFGVLTGGNVSRGIRFNNHGTTPMTLQLSLASFGGGSTRLTVTPSSVNVAPGGPSTEVRVDFAGARPSPGVYEGWLVVQGGSVPLRIPYLYVVGDGVPFSILPLEGDSFEAATGATVPLTFKVTDRYGVPVSGQSIRFQTVTGGGRVTQEGTSTDELGIGWADVILGEQYGQQEFYVAVGTGREFGYYFDGRALLRPSIASGGVVNAASGRAEQGLAPGSYISIYGRGLSEVTRVVSTPYLPLSLSGVSVSFDVPSRNISVPGRLHFVADGQINVQIPWELQGAPSAFLKVSLGDFPSSVIEVPLLDYSPAAFEYTEAGTGRLLAASRDAAFALVGTSNPARKGQYVQIYANGLGPVDNRPASGEPSPANPLATTRAIPTVTIGGRPAQVLFSGLAPGVAGLYQLNVLVPADTPSGLQPVVITANGVQSKPTTLPVE